MKRDMDLIRRMALAIADASHGTPFTQLDGVDERDFALHVLLMREAGLIKASACESSLSESFVFGEIKITRLTWEGYEFADMVRDDALWNKAKEAVLKPASSFTFGVLRDWLKTRIEDDLFTLHALNGGSREQDF